VLSCPLSDLGSVTLPVEQHPQLIPCADDRAGSFAARSLTACAARVDPDSDDNNGALSMTRAASAAQIGQLAGMSRSAMVRLESKTPQSAHWYS
jgi:hypothetical protein